MSCIGHTGQPWVMYRSTIGHVWFIDRSNGSYLVSHVPFVGHMAHIIMGQPRDIFRSCVSKMGQMGHMLVNHESWFYKTYP